MNIKSRSGNMQLHFIFEDIISSFFGKVFM